MPRAVAAVLSNHVEGVEKVLEKLHWADVKDEVKVIKHLLDESKTNHSIKIADSSYKDHVALGIECIIRDSNDHNYVFHQIHDVKTAVKQMLYHPEAFHGKGAEFYGTKNDMMGVRMFSTQSNAKFHDVENKFDEKHWADVKDEVKEIEHIMNESKTNKTIKKPDSAYEDIIMENIKRTVGSSDHDMVAHRLHDLKTEVKGNLYPRRFSTQSDAKLHDVVNTFDEKHWADVKDEVKEIEHIMNESKTNKTIKKPDSAYEDIIMENIKRTVGSSDHDMVAHRLHDLKTEVKRSLYPKTGERTFSTLGDEKLHDVERKFDTMHWADIKDEVKEIESILHEAKTNQFVKKPDSCFEDMVATNIQESIYQNPNPDHDEVFHHVHDLKTKVKRELYPKK